MGNKRDSPLLPSLDMWVINYNEEYYTTVSDGTGKRGPHPACIKSMFRKNKFGTRLNSLKLTNMLKEKEFPHDVNQTQVNM